MRFSIRSLLAFVLIVGLTCGWFSASRSVHGIRKRYEQRLEYAKEELDRAKDQLRDLRRGKRTDRTRSFWGAELEGSDLTGMAIASNRNAFQLASFRNCSVPRETLLTGFIASRLAGLLGIGKRNLLGRAIKRVHSGITRTRE